MKLTECRTMRDLVAVYKVARSKGYAFFDDDDNTEVAIVNQPTMDRVMLAYVDPVHQYEDEQDMSRYSDHMLLQRTQPILIISRLSEEDDPDSDPYFTLTIPCRNALGSDHRHEHDIDTLFFRVSRTVIAGDIDFSAEE